MPNIIYLKAKNGTVYAYESHAYWDKEKKQGRSKRKCIGHVDPVSGEIVPNRPKKPNGYKAKIESQAESVSHSYYGATYLFDEICNQIGLTADLKACFPDTFEQILSIAYYLILEDNNPLSRFEKWNATHKHPYGEDIPSQRSSDLFASIDDDARYSFFRKQAKRRIEKEYWAYDTTSISSYSKLLKQIQYGKNKEDDKLPQLNLAILFGEDSGLPFYYRKLAGNIPDVKTIKNLLADFDLLGYSKVKLVMDRGFYSAENINRMYKEHLKFLIGTSTSLKFIRTRVDAVYDDIHSFNNFDENHGVYATSITTQWDYEQKRPYKKDVLRDKRRMYVHVYYNPDKEAEDKRNLDQMLGRLRDELLADQRVEANQKLYSKYFTVRSTPKRGTKVEPNMDAINQAKQYYGYFTLVSNERMDAITALEIYKAKDIVEKGFGNLKERLNMRRMLVSSETSLEGKLFVEFIALIIISYITKQMQRQKMFKDYTFMGVLDKLDIIECFEAPGKDLRIGEVLQQQRDLYQQLGVAPLA